MSAWKAYLENKPWERRRCLHIDRQESEGIIGIVQPLKIKKIKAGLLITESNGILGNFNDRETDDFLQAVVDAAWEAGIKPTGLEDHINELKAVRYHLEDMRLLAKVRER